MMYLVTQFLVYLIIIQYVINSCCCLIVGLQFLVTVDSGLTIFIKLRVICVLVCSVNNIYNNI